VNSEPAHGTSSTTHGNVDSDKIDSGAKYRALTLRGSQIVTEHTQRWCCTRRADRDEPQ
jgi:hypothetical protein